MSSHRGLAVLISHTKHHSISTLSQVMESVPLLLSESFLAEQSLSLL